jgi:hypothetical protein
MEVYKIMEEINNNVVEGAETQQETKTYSYEEVMSLLQSETDKRVSQALKTQEKKFKKELGLARLDDEAREKAEKENRIAELEQLVNEMNIERNKSELKSVLSSRGLSAEFADILLITDDIEASQENIDKLDKLFKAAVKAEVEKRLAGSAPKGNGGSPAEITKESFRSMSLFEQNQLAKNNRDLYNKLVN